MNGGSSIVGDRASADAAGPQSQLPQQSALNDNNPLPPYARRASHLRYCIDNRPVGRCTIRRDTDTRRTRILIDEQSWVAGKPGYSYLSIPLTSHYQQYCPSVDCILHKPKAVPLRWKCYRILTSLGSGAGLVVSFARTHGSGVPLDDATFGLPFPTTRSSRQAARSDR